MGCRMVANDRYLSSWFCLRNRDSLAWDLFVGHLLSHTGKLLENLSFGHARPVPRLRVVLAMKCPRRGDAST